MVGPLSSEEIEDVVSSVRRLVSNELHPRPVSRDLRSERLVLTAALRVVSETSPLATLVLDAPVVEAAPGDEAAGDEAAFETATADDPLPESAEAGDPVEWAAPGQVEPDVTSAGPVADSAPHPAPAMPETEAGLVIELPASLTRAGAAGDRAIADALADAGVEAGTADPAEDDTAAWEDDIWTNPETASLGEIALAAEEAEVLTGADVSALLPELPTEPLPEALDAAAQSGDWEQAERAWTAADEPVPFVPLRRRAEQLAARVASGVLPDEPPAAATEPEPGSRAEAPSVPEMTEYVDADGMPLAVLDEAALQEIVRQTLRAELQGELGERITRNIRKLVRAEINRAFLARDLD